MKKAINKILEFLENLDPDQRFKLYLSNIRYDLEYGNLSEKIILNYLEAFKKEVNNLSVTNYNLYDLIDKIMSKDPDRFFRKGDRVPKDKYIYIRIMTSKACATHNIERSFGIPNNELSGNKLQEMLKNKINIPFNKNSKLKSKHPIFWCTTNEVLLKYKQIFKDKDELATKLRNVLGLDGIKKNDNLIYFEIQNNIFDEEDIKAPTFLDGCENKYFISINKDNEFGRAIDFDTLETLEKEAVGKEIPLIEPFSKYIVIHDLGKVQKEKPKFEYNEFFNKYIKRI